jgi:hypothetical protein
LTVAAFWQCYACCYANGFSKSVTNSFSSSHQDVMWRAPPPFLFNTLVFLVPFLFICCPLIPLALAAHHLNIASSAMTEILEGLGAAAIEFDPARPLNLSSLLPLEKPGAIYAQASLESLGGVRLGYIFYTMSCLTALVVSSSPFDLSSINSTERGRISSSLCSTFSLIASSPDSLLFSVAQPSTSPM